MSSGIFDAGLMKCDIGTLKIQRFHFECNMYLLESIENYSEGYWSDKMNDIFFFYKNKKTSFCTNVPFPNSISFN